MTVESNVNFITDLDDTLPTSGDSRTEGDDHIRNIKTGVLGSFSGFTGAAVTASEAELNTLDLNLIGTVEPSKAVTVDANSIVKGLLLDDSTSRFVDAAAPTKQLEVDLTSATAATVMTLDSRQTIDRTLILPDANDTLVGKNTVDTLTNKTLTSPVINLAVNATGDIYYRSATGTFARLAIGSAGQLLRVDSATGLPSWGGYGILQIDYTLDSAAKTCATLMPIDGTRPQSTEGNQVLTITFAPSSATSTFIIDVILGSVDVSVANSYASAALFEPSVSANAIHAITSQVNQYSQSMTFSSAVSSNGTSARTFTVRVGPNTGTAYVNQYATGDPFDSGRMPSMIKITEIP